jgi:selenocysteine lyase/cysteine desulfurase
MNLHQIRQDTPACEHVIHFNNAGAALMPKQVADSVRNYITEEENYGGYEVADRYKNELEMFYEYGAQLLNCKKTNIAFTANATDSYNKALSSISLVKDDIVLISANDYSSNYMAFISLQRRFGIKLMQVKNSDTGEIDLHDLESKIKQHGPRLVSITHVPTSSGLVQPVGEIGNIIKKYDTLYLLDACQSLGQMKVDATETGADFISSTFRKFLRGPRGAGLLYVSDKALNAGLEPLYIDLRGADWIAENNYQPRPDAKRFEDWETAFALMMGSKEALKYLLSLGIENIESRSRELSSKLRKALSETELVHLQDKGKQLCNIITFTIENFTEETIKKYFYDKGINIYTIAKNSAIIDFTEKEIEWVVRVSPHYYNTETEIHTFIDALKNISGL